VVLTAPSPTSRTPSFPSAGAMVAGGFTGEIYHAASRSPDVPNRARRAWTGDVYDGRMLFKFARKRRMDPLQVSMTGVRMGERFLLLGCDDRSLLAGLALKVGLSGASAVAVFDAAAAEQARAIAARVGALVDVQAAEPGAFPFAEGQFDLVVVDDTHGRFAAWTEASRLAALRESWRVVRRGGRVEIIEGLGGGWMQSMVARPDGYDSQQDLTAAGFRPVRLLAEKDGFRFVEGLKVV